MTDDADLARRLAEYSSAAPLDPAASGWTHATASAHPTLAHGALTFRWEVNLVDGEPTLSTTLGCDPPMDQADIVALFRREADSLDFDPDVGDEEGPNF